MLQWPVRVVLANLCCNGGEEAAATGLGVSSSSSSSTGEFGVGQHKEQQPQLLGQIRSNGGNEAAATGQGVSSSMCCLAFAAAPVMLLLLIALATV
jgi:hypothetical protein